MKRGEYKNYHICPRCGRELPLNRDYFKRLVVGEKESFHDICKECEIEEKITQEWKDGKLRCHCCGEYKDETEFTPNGDTSPARNGRKSICRECDNKRQRDRNLNLTDEKKLLKCLNSRLLGAKDRSKQHLKLECSLTLADLINLWNIQDGKCALSGIKMTYELEKGRTPTNVSLDRINPSLGYTKDNVQLVCMACNQIKSDLSLEQMYFFCRKILEKSSNINGFSF